jgi:hypothetical protein
VSVNHTLQIFHPMENFLQWKWALRPFSTRRNFRPGAEFLFVFSI